MWKSIVSPQSFAYTIWSNWVSNEIRRPSPSDRACWRLVPPFPSRPIFYTFVLNCSLHFHKYICCARWPGWRLTARLTILDIFYHPKIIKKWWSVEPKINTKIHAQNDTQIDVKIDTKIDTKSDGKLDAESVRKLMLKWMQKYMLNRYQNGLPNQYQNQEKNVSKKHKKTRLRGAAAGGPPPSKIASPPAEQILAPRPTPFEWVRGPKSAPQEHPKMRLFFDWKTS